MSSDLFLLLIVNDKISQLQKNSSVAYVLDSIQLLVLSKLPPISIFTLQVCLPRGLALTKRIFSKNTYLVSTVLSTLTY